MIDCDMGDSGRHPRGLSQLGGVVVRVLGGVSPWALTLIVEAGGIVNRGLDPAVSVRGFGGDFKSTVSCASGRAVLIPFSQGHLSAAKVDNSTLATR